MEEKKNMFCFKLERKLSISELLVIQGRAGYDSLDMQSESQLQQEPRTYSMCTYSKFSSPTKNNIFAY